MADNLEQQKTEKSVTLTFEWWQDLKKRKGDRSDLRRAKTMDEIFFIPAYHRLYNRLNPTAWQSKKNIALIAGVLAHVEEHEGGMRFAARMASPGKSGKGVQVKGMRFRRLLQHKESEEVYGPMIRIIHLMDKRKCNVKDLARCLYWWNDSTRRQWAFEYYEKAPDED